MSTFVQRFTALLKGLEAGMTIKTASGPTLEWSAEHESFGFAATSQKDNGPVENIIFQIDSDAAWLFLVHHARKMTEEQFTVLAANMALNEKKKK